MQTDIHQVLIGRRRIASRIQALARQITADLRSSGQRAPADDLPLTLVPILTGSIIFVADLIRHLPLRMRLNLISVSSYPGASTRSQGVRLRRALENLPPSLAGTHLLVLDDILDTGRTLTRVTQLLQRRQPASLRTCVLLRKDRPTAHNFPVNYVGFDIPDAFVVGFGLDFNGHYRNLPDIVTLKPQVIARVQRRG